MGCLWRPASGRPPNRARVDRRRPPYNRIPKKVLDSLAAWERPILGKVVELHPPEDFPRVCDVGGGMGRLARALRDLGYRVTILDPVRPRSTMLKRVKGRWRRVPIKSQKNAFKGIRVRRRKFLARDARDFDLLVAVRPCGASRNVVRGAKRTPLVLMPCTPFCRVWPGRTGTIAAIEQFFKDMGVGFRRIGRDIFWTGESRRNAYVD